MIEVSPPYNYIYAGPMWNMESPNVFARGTFNRTHNVVTTLNQRQWRWFNVATTSCAQWASYLSYFFDLEDTLTNIGVKQRSAPVERIVS